MNLNPNSIALLLIFFLNRSITASINPTQLADDVSINCGSNGASAARDGREWHGDVRSKFSSLLQIKGSSTATSVIHSLISTDDPVPYTTVRLSLSWFSYAFQVNPGQKVLRFHFNPALYKGVKRFRDLFSVGVGPFTLLSNFSASLTADALGVNSFVKEFCVNIQENEVNIVFSPESSQSLDTYAFINGIEIISVPTSLSYFRGGDSGVQVVGRSLVGVHSSTALEIIRQLNLERDSIPSGSGIRGMFAMWETVSKRKARKTNNIAWKTSVDVGFRYLLRLHFSDVQLKMAGIDGVAFEVRINDMIAVTNIDLVSERDDKNIKFLYKDYIVLINGQKQEGKQDLLICLHSNEEFMDAHAPLKGFEIMKLSNPDNSLACPNPLPSAQDSLCWSAQKLHQVLGHKNVIATFAVALLTLVNIIVHALRIIWEVSGKEEENIPSAREQRICRRVSLGEILLATRNFSDAHLIGKGGFGKVYKGLIDNSQQTVAIKRLKPNSKQGAHEFLTEIETLTKLRHVNLVSLIGYCNEHGEMILVYEYMACGTLADCLYKHDGNYHDCASLTWEQRLSICIGAARGLDYLHTGNSLIHRDVKASNILLDENIIAKVSDFGLAKYLNRSRSESHVSTKVKGTYWYMDPSYVTTGKLTRKSDTYAFGVLLFEVLSGRPAVDTSVAHDERVLITWARENISLGRADKIVASNLRGKISEDSLKAFMGIAERCLHGEPNKRPTMTQVVLQLEFALEQQESSKCLVSSVIKSCVDHKHPFRDETTLPVNTKKLTNDHTYEKNHVHPDKEQVMNKMGSLVLPSGRKNVQKDIIHKPSWLRRWDVLRNRGNLLMNTDKTSGNQETKLVQKNERGVYILPLNASAVPLDELKDKHNINMLPISIPAIPADELKDITDIFGLKCSILEGFCGRVYYGVLKSGQAAAIKKLESRNQPYQEFLAKASMLCSLKHKNVVELLGYCVDDGLRVLVYEFAPHGSLYDILHGQRGIKGSNPGPTLSWAKRVNIAVGAAKGLEYIHDKAQIHGGVKSRNILLFDDNEVAKITDLDICSPNKKSNFLLGLKCFISGGKYISTGQRSWTSDVYSFGLILLELLTGCKPIDHARPIGQQDLVQWAKPKLKGGKVEEFVDARLNGNYPPEAVEKMAEVAGLCMKDEAAFCPNMRAVVEALEPLLNTA